jgi:hypothetical protein
MLTFPTQRSAENHFANGLRLVTTAKDFFKDLNKAFYNWTEGSVQVEEWDKDRAEIINSYNK